MIPIINRPKYKHLKFMPLKEIPEKYKRYDDNKTLLVDYCYIPSGYKKPFAVSATPIFFLILNLRNGTLLINLVVIVAVALL